MTVALGSHLTPAAEAYATQVGEAIGGLEALYVGGSGALGGFDPQRSDIDLVAVVDRKLDDDEKAAIAGAIGELPLPARRLELVVYATGSQPPAFELNLNADSQGAAEHPDEPLHWFVIDAALAQEHAVPLHGPPWSESFAPLTPSQVRGAMKQSLGWSKQRPGDEFAELNAIRARHYLEHGEWITKAEAEARR
jgi:predicted nucleotidyltransferase